MDVPFIFRSLDVRNKLTKYESFALAAARHGSARHVDGYDEVSNAAKGLNAFAESHGPFFAPEVNKALLMLSLTLRQIAVESSALDSISESEIQVRITNNVKETGNCQRALEAAIRGRLYPDIWKSSK